MTDADNKVELTRARAVLVEILTTTLSPEDRVRVQGELSVLNARIKALNTLAAAQLKIAADRRKTVGLAEAQANAARARANAGLAPSAMDDEADDPGQAAMIDAWITTVLGDSGVKVRRVRGELDFGDVPAKWFVVLQRLRAGIHAAARGEELPEDEAAPVSKVKKRGEGIKCPRPRRPPRSR
jgi:hypothetical protein